MHAGRDSAGSNPRLCLKKKGNFLKTGGCMQGAIVRVRIPGYVFKKKEFFKRIYNIPMLFFV